MAETLLQDCPFCGKPASQDAGGYVECRNGGDCTIAHLLFTPEQWNRRAPSEELRHWMRAFAKYASHGTDCRKRRGLGLCDCGFEAAVKGPTLIHRVDADG